MHITLGFVQVWLDKLTSTNCKSKLWFGLDKQLSTLVLKFNFIFSISSGYRQTEYFYDEFSLHHFKNNFIFFYGLTYCSFYLGINQKSTLL